MKKVTVKDKLSETRLYSRILVSQNLRLSRDSKKSQANGQELRIRTTKTKLINLDP